MHTKLTLVPLFPGVFGLHSGEILLVLVVILLIFGPSKLPKLAEAMGKAMKSFKKSTSQDEPPEKPAELPAASKEPEETPKS